jgi:uncharacterized cupin superfamily protein
MGLPKRSGLDQETNWVNRSAHAAKVLEVGNSDPLDRCVYADIDRVAEPGVAGYSHRDGTLYPK